MVSDPMRTRIASLSARIRQAASREALAAIIAGEVATYTLHDLLQPESVRGMGPQARPPGLPGKTPAEDDGTPLRDPPPYHGGLPEREVRGFPGAPR